MESQRKSIELPEVLPVLPVRNTVLFPNAAVPLIVGRTRSVQAIQQAQANQGLLFVVAQRDSAKEDPTNDDLYTMGVVCLVTRISQVENDSYQLIANGLFRFRATEFVEMGNYLGVRGIQVNENGIPATTKGEMLGKEIKQLGKVILGLASIPGSDTLTKLFAQLEDPAQIADLCCTFLNLPIAKKQELLEQLNIDERLENLFELMVKEKERLILQSEIQNKMMERLSKDQRDHLLREQMRTLNEELGEENSQDDIAKKIESSGMSAEAMKLAKEELHRLGSIQRSSPEYHVIRTYLDWLLALPWKKFAQEGELKIDLDYARKILDEDHFGIDRVKKRIIQFLAVAKLKKDLRGPILCLVGPPGVGKTSIGKSIARALGRPFIRTSLGGVRDEAELRGHRRTYIGAMPGRVMQNLKRTGVKDPVIVLDEVDKMGTDFRGDPASVLLEVLDPEQNQAFLDHYIDVPFDLSRVFFITTANVLETIPPALRDRFEIIEMTSYSKTEKLEIAKRHLIPKALTDHGLDSRRISFTDETIELVIDSYTREAGVRNLNREIAGLCRSAAEEFAGATPPEKLVLTADRVDAVLGPKKFFSETVLEHPRPGTSIGLAWTSVGGEILHIEVTKMEGSGKLILTGQLGDVMKESAQIAVSLLRSVRDKQLPFQFDKTDFHIHVPAGAIPKDGPSAGTALFVALASLVENSPIKSKLAMTGEITLQGNVLQVGGIKEKVLAAHRAGVKTILLPKRNEGDLRDVASDVKAQLEFHFVDDIFEVVKLVGLGKTMKPLVPTPPETTTTGQGVVPH